MVSDCCHFLHSQLLWVTERVTARAPGTLMLARPLPCLRQDGPGPPVSVSSSRGRAPEPGCRVTRLPQSCRLPLCRLGRQLPWVPAVLSLRRPPGHRGNRGAVEWAWAAGTGRCHLTCLGMGSNISLSVIISIPCYYHARLWSSLVPGTLLSPP